MIWHPSKFTLVRFRTVQKIPVYELEMESGSTRVFLALLDSPVCGNDALALLYLGHARIKEGHTPTPWPT